MHLESGVFMAKKIEKQEENLTAIYLDENGVNIIRALIAAKYDELQKLAKYSESYKNLLTEIRVLRDRLDRVVIQDRNEDIVNVGDYVEISFDLEDESEIIKLVAGKGNSLATIKEVSMDSPLGKAIHHQPYGLECSYIVNGNEIPVIIKSKVSFDNTIAPQK